ncbi:SpoIIE family protein phosphatase [Streptomyces kronopolitis]|uniref:SpoIIE family protein phosphatase n=1 Tax=Streptomyces kronopolitis TaxID=1612435 RepID=UPI003441B16D
MERPVFRGPSGDFAEPEGEAYAIVDGRGTVLSWSTGAQQLLGYAADEMLGHPAHTLLDDPAAAAGLTERCRDDAPPTLGELVLRHREGRSVEAVVWVHRLTPAGGNGHWLVRAVGADSVRRQNLADSLLRGLFAESPVLIDVFDTRLRYLFQNSSRSRAAGWADEVLGHTVAEAAPPGLMDFTALEARQRRVLATGEASVANEVRGRRPQDPDRDSFWSETIVPLRDRAGEVIGLGHMVIDVTEQARARERLTIVDEAGAKIGSTLDVLHTAQELADVAVPLFADQAYVNLLDAVFSGEEPVVGPIAGAVPQRRAAMACVPDGPPGALVATGEIDSFASGASSLFSRALSSGTPRLLSGEELIAEISRVEPRRAALVREYGVHSWLLVPMYARGGPLGTVVFVRFQRAHGFERDDVLLSEEVVARAGVCIDNARRYTQERTTASALQRTLLPRELPVLSAVEAASRYLPARGRTELGGTWFDVIPLSGARVALVMGGVAGQGLEAAMTMGRLRIAVRTLADLDLAPEELLTVLNDQINRFMDEPGPGARDEGLTAGASGSTCVYAVFDPLSRRCTAAVAGHPLPVLASTDGRAELLDLPGGPPLGRSGATFASGEVTLTDGDVLVLYTRGLVESGQHGPGTGLDRLRELLSGPALTSAVRLASVCDTVVGRLLPGSPQDDAALLVARVRGLDPDRHATWELSAEPEEVGRARALATAKLTEWGLAELEFSTELVVSELVTNALRYGSPPLRLRLIRDRTLICEVTDGSSTSPHVRRALETDEGGRGLYMVAQLAELWGTRYHTRGKTIWAQQPLPEGNPASPR